MTSKNFTTTSRHGSRYFCSIGAITFNNAGRFNKLSPMFRKYVLTKKQWVPDYSEGSMSNVNVLVPDSACLVKQRIGWW